VANHGIAHGMTDVVLAKIVSISMVSSAIDNRVGVKLPLEV
jgi:hypothetical protein